MGKPTRTLTNYEALVLHYVYEGKTYAEIIQIMRRRTLPGIRNAIVKICKKRRVKNRMGLMVQRIKELENEVERLERSNMPSLRHRDSIRKSS